MPSPTPAEALALLRATVAKATPGPWQQGMYLGHYAGSPACAVGERVDAVTAWDGNKDWPNAEVHHIRVNIDEHHIIAANGESVCGNFDYEEGGVIHERDTGLIALAPTLAGLVAELYEALSIVEALHHPSGEGPLPVAGCDQCDALRACEDALVAWAEGQDTTEPQRSG